LKGNGRRLSQYFIRGDVALDRLNRDLLTDEPSKNLDGRRYAASKKVICNLLNTLGVMDSQQRTEVVRNMISAVKPADRIVISVFDAACFRAEAPGLYRHIPRIVGQPRIPDSAFDWERSEFKLRGPSGPGYFSHWFRKDEISNMLLDEGCEIVESKSISGFGHFLVCTPCE